MRRKKEKKKTTTMAVAMTTTLKKKEKNIMTTITKKEKEEEEVAAAFGYSVVRWSSSYWATRICFTDWIRLSTLLADLIEWRFGSCAPYGLLGAVSGPDDRQSQTKWTVKLTWFHNMDATEERLLRYMRGYIMQLIGGILFPDASDSRVHIRCLPLLRDLDTCGGSSLLPRHHHRFKWFIISIVFVIGVNFILIHHRIPNSRTLMTFTIVIHQVSITYFNIRPLLITFRWHI
ncbi:hypothetical protein Ahy_B10g105434 [Arachis hypogaea]|uniref:Aminotransferase-like plant mobile domain-containing protein n=1 Tax=Arachis hypogaea TaxID=3818 RepID=A0A444X7Z6_ARAHY|nr:hypothetical protein Ahy_B10g105434 [Arachis hypogaea]